MPPDCRTRSSYGAQIIMKQVIVFLSVAVAFACARPRYLVIPLEDVEFVGGNPEPIPLRRMARAIPEDQLLEHQEPNPNRRQDGYAPKEGVPGSFIGTLQAANIPSAKDNLASGSNAYASPPQGSDYVDYGAYTGKHGAFGWYSDHPVLLFAHH